MTNKSNNSGHIPSRTCVICRMRFDQNTLHSFYLLGNDLVFDISRAVPNRKKYVCKNEECLSQMDKWLNKQLKKTGALKAE